MTFRYRRLSTNQQDPLRVGGDMVWGGGYRDFLVDSPTAVAQAILTRLLLFEGEWFLDQSEGMPWATQILGRPPGTGLPDSAIRGRILGTPFVKRIYDYSSTYLNTKRTFTVSCKVETAFGPVTQAPAGALISPSGSLVMPLTLRGGPGNRTQPRALPPPQRRLPAPQ